MPASSIADLVNRVARPAPAVLTVAKATGQSAIALAISRNWSASVTMLDDRISDLTTRRDALLAERLEVLPAAALDDDATARARLDQIDRAIGALDTDLARVADARAVAASKAAEERAAAARRDHAAAVQKFDAAIESLTAQAADLDRLAREFAQATLSLANASEAARRLCPGRLPLHPGDHLLGFDRTITSIRRNLRAAGAAWAWSVAEYPPPPTIAETIAEGAAWARTHPADNRFNLET